MRLTHLDKKGKAKMVDITQKQSTKRMACALGYIKTTPKVIGLIKEAKMPKGDVFSVARIAGILAAKQTFQLIPLCHPLAATNVKIDIDIVGKERIAVEVQVSCVAKTGPDMEALTAVAVSCLAIYDMCKSVDRTMTIEKVYLERKSGGKSGTYIRKESKR
jgi:cyclic pyranopterin phosphate synthase